MKLYGEVVDKDKVRYTETSEGRKAHVLRVYKRQEDGKWYYGFEADADLADYYLLEEDKGRVASTETSYVRIGARVGKTGSGPFTERYPSKGRPLEKDLHIQFYVESCNVSEPYGVRWEVTNFGREAERNNDVYHDSGIHHRGDPNFETRMERTKYKGSHYMDCVILKNGHAVCRARHVVNIQ